MDSVLLTGSKGFIGSHVAKKMTERKIKYIELNEDITVSDNLKVLCNYKINRILHIAGKTVVPESWEKPTKYYHHNTFGTLNILEFCRERMIPLTFVSTYVYGNPLEIPITEKTKPNPNNPYAHSKYLAEQLCEFYSNVFDVTVTIIRPFNVYGKGQSNKFLIPFIVEQVLHEDTIRVNDLFPKRDYIYVDDVIEALLSTISYQKKFNVFNVASGKTHSVREIIEITQNMAGTRKNVFCENHIRKNEINNIEVDISSTASELNWYPTTSIDHGILEILKAKTV